jgi:hypothetical protein
VAWLKIDEKIRSHRKLVEAVKAAGGDAGWFWLCGLAYAREQSTDGFLADSILDTVAPGLKGWKKAPAALVAANLWARVEGGYQIRDYFDWNPSRADLARAQQEDRDRKAAARKAAKGDRPDGHIEARPEMSKRTHQPSPYACADAGAFSPSSLPLDSGSSGSLEESPRETTPVVVAARESVASRAAALGIPRPGPWERQHASHAFRGDFCGWVCLPESVVTGFAGRAIGAGQSEAVARESVLAWALATKTRWIASGQIPGDDIFEFWRNEWKATHGTNRPATSLAFTDPLAGVREAERRG